MCLYTHTRTHTLHNLCTQFNLFEPSCLLCYGYNTNTSPGRFQGWEQQTHLPLIPWAKALQPVHFAPDGCFDKCFSFQEPMSCTSVWSVRKWWKMQRSTHGECGLITTLRLTGYNLQSLAWVQTYVIPWSLHYLLQVQFLTSTSTFNFTSFFTTGLPLSFICTNLNVQKMC